MRTVGIIGGLGPESTIDYYRSIIARYRERRRDGTYPHIVIDSLNVDKGIAFLDAGQLDELAAYLADSIDLLARAGADFACIAANTPHMVFQQLERRSKLPLLSIVRATAARAKALHLEKVGLFGTGFTMRAGFYPEEFGRAGITVILPSQPERDLIHRKYIDELLNNRFLSETRTAILNIAERMITENGIEALVLAGTELPLLLRDAPPPGMQILDTTVIHVEAIVDELLNERSS